MKTFASVLTVIVMAFYGRTAMAAYTTKAYGQWVVPWGTTVTKTKRCPQTDVNGLGGELIRFLDGRATWVEMPNTTGVTISNRQTLTNGYRATFTNFAVVEQLPDFHFSMIFQIIVRCRYANPAELNNADIELLLNEDEEMLLDEAP